MRCKRYVNVTLVTKARTPTLS